MNIRLPLLLLFLVMLLSGCAGTRTETATTSQLAAIGEVIRVTGDVSVARRDGAVSLNRGAPIYRGDTVITSKGKVHIRLSDDSIIELGERSNFRFDNYYYVRSQPRALATMSFNNGSMKISTGRLMRQENPTFEVKTPIAIIGVRGTVFWGGFIFGDNTLDVAMLEGRGIDITNDKGQVLISQAGLATTVVMGDAPGAPETWSPQKLATALAATEI